MDRNPRSSSSGRRRNVVKPAVGILPTAVLHLDEPRVSCSYFEFRLFWQHVPLQAGGTNASPIQGTGTIVLSARRQVK